MNTWELIGIIVSILALTGSILLHLLKTTWWMATLTNTLDSLKSAVDKIEKRMVEYEAKHMTREDAFREMGKIEAKADAAHRRLDDLNK